MTFDKLNVLLAIAALAITLTVLAVLGAVVFARTYRKMYGRYFALTIFGILLWAIGDLISLFGRSEPLLTFGIRLFYVSPLIIPISIWMFAISFPENRKPPKAVFIFAGTMFVIYASLILTKFPFFVKSVQVTDRINVLTPQLPGFMFYAGFFSLFFMLTYASFFLKMRKLRGLNRTQVAYTFYGALIASIPALFSNLSLPVMGLRTIIWLGPLFTLFFAGAVAVAIVKHKLFDIRPVIIRSLGYAVTLIIVSSIYGFFVFGLAKLLFGLQFSLVAQITLSVTTGVAAMLFKGVQGFIDKVTKRLFYRDAYEPQELFNDYNKALVSTIDLNVLLSRTSHIISKFLKTEFCMIGVIDSEGQMRIIGTSDRKFAMADIAAARQITLHIHRAVLVADDIASEHQSLHQLMIQNNVGVLVRLTNAVHQSKEGLGYIVLGNKKSGNPYTDADAVVIETLANELIIALQNALRFEEIGRFNETLQQKVADATRRLRATNEKLRVLNETKDDFIGMASHQLRTPLTSVKGYLSLVIDEDAGKINKTQRQLLTQAFVSSQRMVSLIADLLNVSRLKTGKFMIERIPTNIATMITDEIGQLREMAASRGVELIYSPPADFPAVPLDETKTRQVVMNFIDNAIYYTPTGGWIKIELQNSPKSVELRVVDNGIGVPVSERHHLFTKFYRAKNAQRARPDGTGLGLFMAKKVITAQGGSIIFDSVEGQGSTFGFSFPKEPKSDAVALPDHSKA